MVLDNLHIVLKVSDTATRKPLILGYDSTVSSATEFKNNTLEYLRLAAKTYLDRTVNISMFECREPTLVEQNDSISCGLHCLLLFFSILNKGLVDTLD